MAIETGNIKTSDDLKIIRDPVAEIAPSPADLRIALATAEIWKKGYKAIDLDKVLVRQWKLPEDLRKPIEIIGELPDSQKPHLPEGYVWLKEGNDLTILGHKDAPQPLNFRIFLFGPDGKKRVQYLVADQGSPIHGFAMAKREGFPAEPLRDLFPIATDSFKSGTVTNWRGHIIDYMDTLGAFDEPGISTLFALNYKPEPAGAWARTLRKELVKGVREVDGSYSEVMLYDPSPERTNGGRAVPGAVFLETFYYANGGRMGGYYVPKHHECHGWKKEPRERDFAKKSIGKLSEADTFPAVVFESAALLRGEEPVAWRAAPKNPQELDLKEAYHLRRRAEVEFDGAANMLSYALYAKIHGASSPVLQFWLGRVVDMAAKIESAYESKVLAYPFSLMNLTTEAFSLDTNPDLKSLVGRLSIITENMATASSRLMNPIAVKTEEVPPIVQSAEKEIKPDTNQSAAESVQRAEKVQEEARCRNHTLLILAFAITALFFAASSSMRLEKRH